MKIRKISLENLNSLVGEHELDLTAEPIASAGIFAITGPTGAGKSTLLDAITLALYGRAARYDRPNPEDMMSRHHGKCRAEVEFEVKGEIYRAEWTRHRAREKADGKMQGAKRFVYDAAGEVLTQGLGEADEKVEEICGLNYERFMRSALLAQGEFARFLKSKEDERAELLESLTGTEVFSELSEMVYEEAMRQARELEDQEKLLGGIEPLAPEARAEIEKGLAEKEAAVKEKRLDLRKVMDTLSRADALAQTLDSEKAALVAQKSLALERQENESGLERLARHRVAEPYFPMLHRSEDAQRESERITTIAKQAARIRDESTAQLESGVASAAALVKDWIAARVEVLARLKKKSKQAAQRSGALEVWLKTRRSDATLNSRLPELFEKIEALRIQREYWTDAHKKITALKADQHVEISKRVEREKVRVAAATKVEKAAKAQADAGDLLRTNEADKDDDSRRREMERLRNLIVLREKLCSGEAVLTSSREKLAPEQERAKAAVGRRKAAAELLARHEAHLQTETLRARLEEHRANLKDGEACPLCGSFEHPLAGHELDGSRLAELKSKVADAKTAVDQAEKVERASAKELAELEAGIRAGEAELVARRAEVKQGCEELGIADGGAADLGEMLRVRTKELGEIQAARKALELAGRSLELAQRDLEKIELEGKVGADSLVRIGREIEVERATLSKAVRAGEQATADLEGGLDPFSELVPAAGKELDLRESLAARAKAYLEQESAQESAREAVRSAAAEEKELNNELARLREREEALGEPEGAEAEAWVLDTMAEIDKRLTDLDKGATSATAAAAEREKQLATVKDLLAGREAELKEALLDSPFPDAAELKEARIEADELGRLVALEKRLAEEGERLKGRLDSCAEALKRLREASIPAGEAVEGMREQQSQLEQGLEALSDEVSAQRAVLKADDGNRELLEKKGAALVEGREELKTWQRLNGLIGSADGKKFRRFAQGLSLDVLVRHANSHLERLSERYQLARREGEELGLEIVDLFQASVTRPMASLSGGESFLASLALALGLSDLAGRNVQIDSLFIDEGFGSLDGDTLDEAISALEALRLREKTVGVISHVELLKERISTQVVVGLDAGGRGRLEVVG